LPAFTTARVLTVEDDPIVRADLRLILEEAGFDVCADARNGVEAVELARTQRPDLVLIDLQLPGVDGVEATRRILRDRHIPVVALTGHRSGGYVERALEAGAVAHVLKPFHEAHLLGTITNALANHIPSRQPETFSLADEDDFNQRAMVESMVRGNYSEREIAAALRGAYSWSDDLAAAAALFRRIGGWLRR
jgi:response regulator NasT